MTVKIRLARRGTKKKPHYRIVAAQDKSPRDGKFLEILGTYHPLLDKTSSNRVNLKSERVNYWLSVGAKPSERVKRFLKNLQAEPANS